MKEMDENVERTVATRAFGGETATPTTDPETGAVRPETDPERRPAPAAPGGAGPTPASRPAAAHPKPPEPVPSLAAVFGHPIHPMVVPLPIGALSLALATDVLYAATKDRFWARTSTFLIGSGIVSGAVAGSIGSVDFLGRSRIRRHPSAWAHAGGNIAALGISAINLAVRRNDRGRRVVPLGLALSIVTGLLLLVTGWLGGELSYRHGIGMPGR